MTGFEFIAKAFKASYTDIAKRLNMTPSAIADWASGRRPIPKDKLPLVSKLFRIDEEYFKKKELTEVEKIKIEINYLERLSKRDTEQIPDTYTDDEGNQHETYFWYNPHEGELRYKYEELAYEELVLRIKRILTHDFALDMEYQRTRNHFHVVKELTELLDQDDGTVGIMEFEDISKEEAQRRRNLADRVNSISRMLYFLNGGKLHAFGKIDEFDEELFKLLRKFKIIDTKLPKKLKELDDPFDHRL
ncbi:helix-turn-helix domain-containing protein [Paenibacillus sp. SYP-B3998]|uniref:Helix-turn-helix domain-containing protein n=1 Tax=Paenibacillus sp. SYP-B3998 TaxID=2678564 RepID=A0A6G3ZRP5_9BACL|nr:helix-turn-helix domain-containing protein [Paenibacillus sp. SYP-B3998]NEW04708.1 helix-turn-helix domain-containing protein [Paenibacillus sp. SYP-B3998]